MSLHIDWTACDGRGLCVELLPELLDQDEWGYPVAKDGRPTRDVPVPVVLEKHALRAVAMCPRLALSVMRP